LEESRPLFVAAAWVTIIAVIAAVYFGCQAHEDAHPLGGLGDEVKADKGSGSPTTISPPTLPPAVKPKPAYEQRYQPTRLRVALGDCGTSSPPVDLSVPKTGSESRKSDFTYESCATPPSVRTNGNYVEAAFLKGFSVPQPAECDRAINTAMLSNHPLYPEVNDILCFRKSKSAIHGVKPALGAIHVDAIEKDALLVTAYSWNLG
jgi:hypothetical protein